MNLKDRFQSLTTSEPCESRLDGTAHFGKGISPLNLRLDDDEGVSVSLGEDLPGLTRELSRLGSAMLTTGNGAVSLTQTMAYPEFQICKCGRRASNAEQGLHFDFRAWRSVWARQQRRTEDLWRMLAVSGRDRRSAHQALWLDENVEEKFAALARRFQGPTGEVRHRRWETALAAPDEQHLGFIAQFVERKKAIVENPRCGARLISRQVMPELWRGVLEEKIRLHTTVISAPVIQAALWRPESVTEQGGDIFIRSGSAFLRCGYGEIAELWLVPMLSQGNVIVSVEAYGENDTMLFALTPSTEFQQPWSELLRWLPSL